MPGGIRNGFIKFVNKVLPDGLPIPGRADSAEDEEEEKFDTDLHLYDREGLFYVLIIP